MNEWIRERTTIYGFITLGAAIAFALHEVVNWSTLSATEWAAWFGAIGTVGTLIGTLWLATGKERSENRQAVRRAHVIAAGLAPLLQELIDNLTCIQSSLDFNDTEQFPTLKSEAAGFLALDNVKIASDDLGALTVLEGDHAFRLARAISMLTLAQASVRTDINFYAPADILLTKETAEQWRLKIAEVSELFYVVNKHFTYIALAHASAPSGAELWGDE